MRSFVECDSPGCYNCFFINKARAENSRYVFCPSCRKQHSTHVLTVQAEHEKPIKEVLLEAKVFNSSHGMADYIGVSFVTIYHWIKKYFSMTFQEFRRHYICKSDSCYYVDITDAPYSRGDYILRKVKDHRYCACINELKKKHMLTTAPIEVMQHILGGEVKIKTFLYEAPTKLYPISSGFNLTPIRFTKAPTPIYISA